MLDTGHCWSFIFLNYQQFVILIIDCAISEIILTCRILTECWLKTSQFIRFFIILYYAVSDWKQIVRASDIRHRTSSHIFTRWFLNEIVNIEQNNVMFTSGRTHWLLAYNFIWIKMRRFTRMSETRRNHKIDRLLYMPFKCQQRCFGFRFAKEKYENRYHVPSRHCRRCMKEKGKIKREIILHRYDTVKFKFIPFFCIEWHLEWMTYWFICVTYHHGSWTQYTIWYTCDVRSNWRFVICDMVTVGHCSQWQVVLFYTYTMKFRWENR